MKDKLIKPVKFLGKGNCPFCMTVLKVYESEMNAIIIDEDGVPRDINNEYTKILGLCESCGRTFTMVKNGMAYEPYSELKAILQEEKLKNINKEKHFNPFGFEKEGDK